MKNKAPKLRFPEFSGEWSVQKGKNLYSLLGGNPFDSKDSQNEGIKWLKIANVGINTMKNETLSYLPKDYLEKFPRYVLKINDIVIALTRPILNSKLKIAKIDLFFNNSLLNQRVAKVIPLNKNINDFIYYILQRNDNVLYLENKIAGTDPPNLSNTDLINSSFLVPSFKEQEKIANFLSEVDIKIEKLEKKK
ncbi:MAG: restriction endonuclease subunit S, partial [Fusobacteriaceae bacterium]